MITSFTEGSRPAGSVAPMRRLLVLASLAIVVVLAASVTVAQAKKPIRVTFVGDSVAASIYYASTAQAQLRRGFKVQLDLRVCRRLGVDWPTGEGSTA